MIINRQTAIMETTALPYPDMDLADIVTEHRYVTERLVNIAKFQAETRHNGHTSQINKKTDVF